MGDGKDRAESCKEQARVQRVKPRPIVVAARLAAVTLFLAAVVPAYDYAELSFLRENEPQAAYRKNPVDARALGQVLGQRFADDPGYVPDKTERDHLQRAVRARPLSPELLAVEGLMLERQAKPAEALAAMRIANRTSRRGGLASIWLIEAASSANDVPEAIRHYNNALSVHPALREQLLPVLARGLAFPAIRSALVPYLGRPASWTAQFLDVAVRESSLRDLQALLTPLPASLRNETFQPLMGIVLQRIAAEAGARAATSFASNLIPDLDPKVLSTMAPSRQTLDPRLGPLAWQFPEDGGIAVRAVEAGMLELTVQPLANGLAAQRDLLLTGGKTYALTQRFSTTGADTDVRLIWRASCNAGGEMIGFWEKRVPSNGAPASEPLFLKVPAGCLSATLALLVEGPDGQSPVTATISHLALRPAE